MLCREMTLAKIPPLSASDEAFALFVKVDPRPIRTIRQAAQRWFPVTANLRVPVSRLVRAGIAKKVRVFELARGPCWDEWFLLRATTVADGLVKDHDFACEFRGILSDIPLLASARSPLLDELRRALAKHHR